MRGYGGRCKVTPAGGPSPQPSPRWGEGADSPSRLDVLHHRRHEALDFRATGLLHRGPQLGAQQLQNARDARLAEGAEPPEIGPSDRDAARAHAKRLDDIGAAAEA